MVNPKQEPDIIRVAAIGTLCAIKKERKEKLFLLYPVDIAIYNLRAQVIKKLIS